MKHQEMTAQAWALSALLLAADRVRDIAEHAAHNEAADLALLPSLVRFDCDTIAGYYDNPAELERGRCLVLNTFFEKNNQVLFRYVSQLLHAEAKLAKNKALMQLLKQRLKAAQRQSLHFPLNHENLLANFASVYRDTVGKAVAPIMVQGNPLYLKQENYAAHIRALLLCGVRAAALWRGYGGSKRKILFSGQQLLTEVKQLRF